MELKDALKIYREKNQFTRDYVAEKVFSSPKTIESYEYGTRTPSQEMLRMLAALYNITIKDFYDKERVLNEKRKLAIKNISVTVYEEKINNTFEYYVEIYSIDTSEILEEYTKYGLTSFQEAEMYVENEIEKRFNVIRYFEESADEE